MSDRLNVRGIDKAELPLALWHGADHTDRRMSPAAPRQDEIKRALSRGYVKFFCGRTIMCDLGADRNVLCVTEYDRHQGGGLGRHVVEKLRTNIITSGTTDGKQASVSDIESVTNHDLEAVKKVRNNMTQAQRDAAYELLATACHRKSRPRRWFEPCPGGK